MQQDIRTTKQVKEAEMLYERNLEWLSKIYLLDYEMIKEHKYIADNAEFDTQGNMVNLCINGQMLYPEDAPAYVTKQIKGDDAFSKIDIDISQKINFSIFSGRSYAIRKIASLERQNANDSALYAMPIGQKLLNNGDVSFADLAQEYQRHADYKTRPFVI